MVSRSLLSSINLKDNEKSMKISPKELSEIRKGLACQMLKMKVDNDKKAIDRIEDLLNRLDEMEDEFYNALRDEKNNNSN